MNLSQKNLKSITSPDVVKPVDTSLKLPERVLQFGTGVLLRGLPDYFIDKANRVNIFNGRIVLVKSTDTGDTNAFDEQDSLYTLCIRGITGGKKVEENIICSCISRVLSAKQQWNEILKCAHNAEMKLIISNTTEVGLQLLKGSIFQQPPVSFPGKLAAFLYERYKAFDANESAGIVVVPTELITDNGGKLRSIVIELANYNNLEEGFINWLSKHNFFCSSLVDCIVPGKPDVLLQGELDKQFSYNDKLTIITEPYRLWAIEGDDKIKSALSFADVDKRVIITPDISKYKELKLRLLNGTHTLTCGLAYLSGINIVKDAMENEFLSEFITNLMLDEIAPAIPYPLNENDANDFGLQVLDRFRNPYIQHQWLSITMQYSSKLALRAIPILLRYYELYKKIPENLALGFAAYLLFMKPEKEEGGKYFGELNGQLYFINDDRAADYYKLWLNASVGDVVKNVLSNESLWQTDLLMLDGFEVSVKEKLEELMRIGAMQTLTKFNSNKNYHEI